MVWLRHRLAAKDHPFLYTHSLIVDHHAMVSSDLNIGTHKERSKEKVPMNRIGLGRQMLAGDGWSAERDRRIFNKL